MGAEIVLALAVLALGVCGSVWIMLPVRVTMPSSPLLRKVVEAFADTAPPCPRCGRLADVLGGTPYSTWWTCPPCGHTWLVPTSAQASRETPPRPVPPPLIRRRESDTRPLQLKKGSRA